MFVFRCAFWLTIGFLLVAPHGTDFGATATALKNQAVTAGLQAGQQLIVSQIVGGNRLPDLLVSSSSPSSSTPSVGFPMQDSPAVLAVFPRARPAAMG